MKNKILGAILLVSFSLMACNKADTQSQNTLDKSIQKEKMQEEKMELSQKEIALMNQRALETGDKEILKYMAEDYRIHRPEYPTGRATFEPYFSGKETGFKTKTIRIFEDDNIVVTHNYSTGFAEYPIVSIDIYGFKNGVMVDYWDNMTFELDSNNTSQYDGETTVTDLDKTDSNKALVQEYMEKVYVNKEIETVNQFVNKETLIQHSPNFTDGIDALKNSLKESNAVHNNLVKVLGEGNFVLAILDGNIDEKATTFYYLYRLDNGNIVEQWEIIEEIAPEEKWANKLGRTNFNY